jgi:hypothetical protein
MEAETEKKKKTKSSQYPIGQKIPPKPVFQQKTGSAEYLKKKFERRQKKMFCQKSSQRTE